MSLRWAVFIFFQICIIVVAIVTWNMILIEALLGYYIFWFIIEIIISIIIFLSNTVGIKVFKFPKEQIDDYFYGIARYARFFGIWAIVIGLAFAIKTLYLTVSPNPNELLTLEIQITNYLVAIFCIVLGVAFLIVKNKKYEI